MKLVDTHAHLDFFIRRGELAQIAAEARAAGVERVITPSTSPENWLEYERAARESGGFISWQIGIHPSDIDENSNLALDALAGFAASDTPPVAVGEIGLDFHFLPNDKEQAAQIIRRQREIFRRQLMLAADLNLPVCVHAREAVDDAIAAMREVDFDFSRAVFHCFSGSVEQIGLLNSLGARASFTGIITYKNAAEMRECMLRQGLEKIMFETDCPYLSPEPVRKSVNKPANIAYTVRFAAELFGVSAEELAGISSANAGGFFRI